MNDQRLTIVVTAAARAEANVMGKLLDTEGGERTFSVGLSPTGLPPLTHYWCSVAMTAEQRGTIESMAAPLVIAQQCWVFDGNVFAPDAVLDSLGLRRVEVI